MAYAGLVTGGWAGLVCLVLYGIARLFGVPMEVDTMDGVAEMVGQSCYQVQSVEHGRLLMERAMEQACSIFGRDKLQTVHIVVQLQVRCGGWGVEGRVR